MSSILSTTLFMLLMFWLISCGRDNDDDKNSVNNQTVIEEQQEDGSYRAILRPINNSLSGLIPTGVAEVFIDGDNLKIKTLLDDDAKVIHIQNVHLGTRCPSTSDDSNGDGLIDMSESYSIVKQILLPLDSDLNSLESRNDTYPLGGGFTYVGTASISKIDNEIKSRMNQHLNITNKVVLIHGVATSTKLPTTVGTPPGVSVQSSIPIACGVLKRI